MKSLFLYMLLVATQSISAQNIFKARVSDINSKEPLVGATALVKGTSLGATSNIEGIVEIDNIPDGPLSIEFRYVGYETLTIVYGIPTGSLDMQEVQLKPDGTDLEEVVVSATRSSRTIDDIPLRIETVAAGELEEKAVSQPSNIKMILTESTGIQTQQTSATSGSTSIRIQGLDGKYTQILKDGFPIYSGFASGLSILQIPPLDLKRVEVIKGSASTLYGGGAIAGLINLVTKQPTEKREISFLANYNQTKAWDFSGYYGEKFRKWGVTIYTARNSQAAYDANNDGFSDIPQFIRYTINPRVFYYGNSVNVSLGLNTSWEDRTGGDMQVIAGNGDATHTYFEKNKSNRYATQIKIDKRFNNKSILTAKNSIGYFARDISLSDYIFSGTQVSSYTEVNYLIPGERSEWVSGVNIWTDHFTQDNPVLLPLDYQLNTYGAFAQNNFKPSKKVIIETGLRLDYNSQKNTFFLPRLALMYKFSEKLTSRFGMGLGYKAPTLFSEEAESKSFRNIQPLNLNIVKPEESTGGNFDINYKTALSAEADITINQMFFYTEVRNPLALGTTPFPNGNFEFNNANGKLISRGFETNLKLSIDELWLYLGYTYIEAERDFNGVKTFNPLTAKQRINSTIMYEIEGKLRVAYEVFYIGPQHRSTGDLTPSYWVMGISAEWKFERFSLFANAENFTDSRQTRFDQIYSGTIQNPQFKEIYSPIEGYILNGGFRVRL